MVPKDKAVKRFVVRSSNKEELWGWSSYDPSHSVKNPVYVSNIYVSKIFIQIFHLLPMHFIPQVRNIVDASALRDISEACPYEGKKDSLPRLTAGEHYRNTLEFIDL